MKLKANSLKSVKSPTRFLIIMLLIWGGGAGSSKSKAAPASKFAKKSEDDKTESKPEDSNVSREKEDSSEEENLKTVGKSAGAKSRSSKEIPKAGTSQDQGDSGKSKASSKKK